MVIKVLDCQAKEFSDGNVMYELTLSTPVGIAFKFTRNPYPKGTEGKAEFVIDSKHKLAVNIVF